MAKSRSLSWRLGVSVLVIGLPIVAFGLMVWIAYGERDQERSELVGDADAFADTVGHELNAYFRLASALSHSRFLQRADLTGVAEQVRDTLAEAPGVKLIVPAPSGDPVPSIQAAPPDSSLLGDRAALVQSDIVPDSAFLSDVKADPALPEANALFEAPRFLEGKPIYKIPMLSSLKGFRQLAERHSSGRNELFPIIDRNAVIERTPNEFVRQGALLSADYLHASIINSIDGQKIVSAYAPVEEGWTVGVAANARGLGIGPIVFALTSLVAALAMLGGLLLAYLNRRTLTRRVQDLESKTRNVLTDASVPAPPSTGIADYDRLSDALATTSELLALRTEQHRHTEQELRSREEHLRLLADSLPQLVWTAGPDGRIEYTNARRERYAAIGQTDWEGIIHPDDRRATAEAWLRAREAAVPYEMEHRLFAIGKGYAWHLSRASPLLDAQGAVVRWYGTTTDIDDQKHREANIRDLMAEVNHRSRNLLAVAQAIARCGVANAKTVQGFQERYSERLLGLAASQDLLTDRNWRGVPLESLVQAQTSRCRERRFASRGPLVLLNPNATQTLGLALRELCDNALKHGAFSKADGEVSLVWRIDDSDVEPRLEMIWQECGGPPVDPAATSGFGKVIIERLTAAGLNASSILSFEPDSVTWRLVAPLKDVVKTGTGDSPSSEWPAEVVPE